MTNFKNVKALSAILLILMLSLGLFFAVQGQTGTSSIAVTSMPNLSITQIVAGNPNYSTLANLLQLANLTDTLNGSLSLTVFAPTNDAFAKLPIAALQNLRNNPSLLRSVLAYHIIPNTAYTLEQLRNLQLLPTASGQAVQISATATSIRINNATLISPSISARAGIIYTVDTVLVPPANATDAPMIVPANQTALTTPFDLTNQNSPYAAAFLGNTSITKVINSSLPQVNVQLAVGNLVAPMMVVPANDATGRLFVVDQIGLVWIIAANGTKLSQPFMDLRSRIVPLNPSYDERGLLSLAFHPNFTQNGKLYVHYDAPLRQGAPANWSHTVHIAEFTVNRTNPNQVDNSSERTLMLVDKPQSNHNGGPVLFGSDGYLYLTLGDGGGANDVGVGHTNQSGNAQDLTKVLGKTLRIDINQNRSTIDLPNRPQANLTYVIFSGSDVIGTRPYGIPPDNPFMGFATLPPKAYGNLPINGTIPLEIYSYGHRNPAFANFYSANSSALMVSEAGQLLFEEVNLVRRGGNYGWHFLEGTHPFNASAPSVPSSTSTTVGYLGEPLIGPIFEGGHDLGQVVVGGATYWGNAIPALRGKFVFGYFGNAYAISGKLTLLVASPPVGWNASDTQGLAKCMMPGDNMMWQTQQITVANALQTNATGFVRGVFADRTGELYVMMSSVLGPNASLTTGRIYKIIPAAPTPTPAPTPSPTPTPTPTPTPSITPTPPAPSPTATATPLVPTPSPTATAAPTPTVTPTATPTATPTVTPAPTASPGPISIQLYASEFTFGTAQNALMSPGPTLNLRVGQTVTVTLTNVGNMPHAWALTTSNTGGTVLFGAAIGSAGSGIQPGQSASDTFTVTQAGNFFYVCPIPGHAQLGMWGNVVVTP